MCCRVSGSLWHLKLPLVHFINWQMVLILPKDNSIFFWWNQLGFFPKKNSRNKTFSKQNLIKNSISSICTVQHQTCVKKHEVLKRSDYRRILEKLHHLSKYWKMVGLQKNFRKPTSFIKILNEQVLKLKKRFDWT